MTTKQPNPQYMFGSAAGEVLREELKGNPFQFNKFARHFAKYCARMNALQEIRVGEERIFLMQLCNEHAKETMKRLFNDKILPKRLLTFALNSVSYINKKHLRGNRFNKRLWKLMKNQSILEKRNEYK